MGLSNYNGFTGREREASLRRVHKLWDSGEVPRPTECMACGQTKGTIHGHSEDYSNDHVHIPLCITCHLILHMRFQLPAVWDQYRERVRQGWQGTPLEQRNALYRIKVLYVINNDTPDNWPMALLNEPRSGTVLDVIPPIKFAHPNATNLDAIRDAQGLPRIGQSNNPFAMP